MLLIENNSFLLDLNNIISEDRKAGRMTLRGVFQRTDEMNANGRIYTRPIMEREVKKLQPLVKENRLLGELDHPESDVVRLQNASHMITKLGWKGNEVIGECTLLNTPAGLTAQTLIRDGVKIGISSRGLGTLTDIGEAKEVNADYDMRTFDLVADPSTRGAFPGITESANYIVEGTQMIERAHKKAMSERVLVQTIKKSLDDLFDTPKELVEASLKGWDSEHLGSIVGKSAKRRGVNSKTKTPNDKRTDRQNAKIEKAIEKRGGREMTRFDKARNKSFNENYDCIKKVVEAGEPYKWKRKPRSTEKKKVKKEIAQGLKDRAQK